MYFASFRICCKITEARNGNNLLNQLVQPHSSKTAPYVLSGVLSHLDLNDSSNGSPVASLEGVLLKDIESYL